MMYNNWIKLLLYATAQKTLTPAERCLNQRDSAQCSAASNLSRELSCIFPTWASPAALAVVFRLSIL